MRILLGAALGAIGSLATVVSAQNPLNQPGFVAGGPAAVAGVAHALDQTSRGADNNFVNAYGEPFVMPAQYSDPMGGGACYGYGGGGGGGGGYGPPGTGGEPYGGAYMNTEQCGPHYFDFSAEFLHYQRDSAFSDLPVSFSGFATEDIDANPNFNNNVVMRTGDLSSDSLNGYRLTGRVDVGALSVFEVSYSGLEDSDSAVVDVSADGATARLSSLFSRFGTRTNGPTGDSTAGRPIDDVVAPNNNPGGNNYAETDFATRHDLTYKSELHNAEALFRRYWVGANPRVSGTILLGFRYTSLSEQLGFSSIGSTQTGTSPDTFAADPSLTIDINADADNHLAGFECGADGWVTLLQGLRVGGEAKVGIYNNDYNVSTSAIAGDGSPSTVSTISGDQVAFLTEVKLMAVADITSSISLKGGYELLFISDMALAGDSLVFAAPYGDPNGAAGSVGGAPPSTNNDIVFHGFHAGIEYVW